MQSPYLLIPISLLVLTSYLLSHVFVRIDILSKKKHRQFWNIILLITFLIAGILGLLLAIQINYKLEWTLINKFLNWHVNFGIAMALVAIIHFLWHLDYYLKLFRIRQTRKEKVTAESEPHFQPDPRQNILIWFSGFYAPIVQVLLIRELTTQFQGNEIMMTWTLGLWMVLTGIGSLLGRRVKIQKITPGAFKQIFLWIAFAPILMVLLLNWVKDLIFPPGIMIGPGQYVLIILYILTPICIFTGLLFTFFVRTKNYTFTRVYLLEAVGSILGGLIVSLVLLHWFSVLQSLLFVASTASIVLFIHSRKYLFLGLAVVVTISGFYIPSSPVEKNMKSMGFGKLNVVESGESTLGNITVTENGGEYNYFLNGSLLFSSGDFVVAEEFVHYAMLQHENPKHVLLVSGGMMGMVNEILKYPTVTRIDYVELNEKLLDMAGKRNPLPDTSILHVSRSDIYQFLNSTHNQFDVVILAVPDPSSIQLNRYYTDEFMTRLKGFLNKNAVIIYGLPATGNYMSDWQKKKLSLIYNTLKKHFVNVVVIPGERDYFVASDQQVSTSIARLCNRYKLDNLYVNPDYLEDEDIQMRSNFIMDQLDENAGINKQHKAMPSYYSSLKYLSRADIPLSYLWIPILLLPLILILLRPGMKGMYLAGMSGASIEIILIFVIQIAFGYIYTVLGILIALFMAGLALGAYLSNRIPVTLKRYRAAFLMMIAFLVLFYFFMQLHYLSYPHLLLWSAFTLFMLIPSTLAGYIFVAATRLFPEPSTNSAPRIYAADLIGAAMGIICMTLILIPVLGVPNACLILAALNSIPLFSRSKTL